MVGRYPDYDVFDSVKTWDAATRRVVDERMRAGIRSLRFFTPHEEATLRAFCDAVTAQDRNPRVPVAELVDQKLEDARLDGYQYADMPDDRETWRRVLRGLDESADRRYARSSFAHLDGAAREAVIDEFAKGLLQGGTWDSVNVQRAFSVCMRAILSAFYSHPWAWNEIGYGGPAYPRGYMRLGPLGVREPYERPGATDGDPVLVAGEEP